MPNIPPMKPGMKPAPLARRPGMKPAPRAPQNTGPLPPHMAPKRPQMGMGAPMRTAPAPTSPSLPGKRPPIATMAEGGKVKKKPGKK